VHRFPRSQFPQNSVPELYPVLLKILLRGEHTRRKTVGGKRPEKATKGLITASNLTARVPELPRRPLPNGRRDLNVQQILAGEFRLVGNEGKPRLGLGAHQPFDGIGRALAIVG
jgi:hypothetical protein